MNSFHLLVLASCCVAGALAKTACEAHREKELTRTVTLKFVPECDENGEYKTLQCFLSPGTHFCMCWTPEGRQINGPSQFIKSCDCYIHSDRKLAEAKLKNGVFVPACNEDGTYAKKQCNKATGLCWCADEKGNKVSTESKGSLTC